MHTTTEQHKIEIDSVANPAEKLKLQTMGAEGDLIEVRLSTAHYNVAVVVRPEQLLLAARTLNELPVGRDSVEPTSDPSYPRMRRILDEVAAERARQNALYDQGEQRVNLASANTSPGLKLAPITEEFLEAVQEIQMLNTGSTIQVRDIARRQLRVAAIRNAAAWTALAESLQP